MKYGIRFVPALDAAVFHISEGWSEAVIEQRVTRDQARTKRLSRATPPLSIYAQYSAVQRRKSATVLYKRCYVHAYVMRLCTHCIRITRLFLVDL